MNTSEWIAGIGSEAYKAGQMAKNPQKPVDKSHTPGQSKPGEDKEMSWVKVLAICGTILVSAGGALAFIDRQWDRHTDQIGKRIESFETTVNQRFGTIDSRFATLDGRLERMEGKMDNNQQELLKAIKDR